MSYQQGDIVIVRFPYTDLTDFKPRPALIVSNASVNRSGDYTVVMLTTQRVDRQFRKVISNGDVTIPFNPPHSRMNVNCKKIAVLHSRVIHRKITEIADMDLFDEILANIKAPFDRDR